MLHKIYILRWYYDIHFEDLSFFLQLINSIEYFWAETNLNQRHRTRAGCSLLNFNKWFIPSICQTSECDKQASDEIDTFQMGWNPDTSGFEISLIFLLLREQGMKNEGFYLKSHW